MCGCCAACQETSATQLSFHESRAADEVVSPLTLHEKSASMSKLAMHTLESCHSGCQHHASPTHVGSTTLLRHMSRLHSCGSMSCTSARKPRPSRSFASVQDLEEQTRIITMVTAFAKKAVQGCSCTHVDEHTGRLTPAKYFVDKDLLEMTLVTSVEGSNPDYRRSTCAISGIQYIYTFLESNPGEVSAHIEALKPEEKRRALHLTYKGSDGEIADLIMLEESPNSALDTAQSLQVLCMSAKPDSHSTSHVLCVSARMV